jgi:hypothetical protein
MLAFRRLRDWRSGGGVTFGKGTFISSPLFDKGHIHVFPARPRVDIDSLKADRPNATKKDDDAQSDEKEVRGR